MNANKSVSLLFLLTMTIFVQMIAISKVAAQTRPVCSPPPGDMVLWIAGDGNAADLIAQNNGTLRNGVGFAAGKVGPGFRFDGINDSILIPSTPSLNLNDHTIETWVYPGTQQGEEFHGLVVKQNTNNTGRNYYLGLRTDGRIHYSISGAGTIFTVDSKTALQRESWTHVAATFNKNVMSIFINGKLDNSLTVGNLTLDKTGEPLLIGHTNENAATFFNGLIDEIGIFNRALSADELLAIVTADVSGKCRSCRQVYANNFNDNNRVGTEWRVYDTCDHERCNTPPRTNNGESFMGQYRFFDNESCSPRDPTDSRNLNCPDGGTSRVLNRNDAVLTLNSSVLGVHNSVRVAFDLYIIGQWDGSTDETWELRYDTGINTSSTRLGLERFKNTTGLQKRTFTYAFSHPTGKPLRLTFSVRGVGPVPDTAWGVDNVVVTACSGISSCATVSAANYAPAMASESIASAFGLDLATGTAGAAVIPLPERLLETSIRVKDSTGVERPAPLFFVSPLQTNFEIPPSTANGIATVTIQSGDGTIQVCVAPISTVAPGVFTADSTGRGLAAAQILRVRSNGSRDIEPVARFDAATNQYVAVPIDLGPETDQVFLILYGTGLRFRSNLSAVSLVAGGVSLPILYAGPQGSLVGLDQINASLSRSLIGRGTTELTLSVDGTSANIVRIQIK